MAVPEFDNRLRFSSTEINFDDDVGVTGQTHDTYPAPGQQPRYDWMRMFLIALLSCQSSDTPPSQKRTGTIWFKRDLPGYMAWNGTAWVPLADLLKLGDSTDDVTLSAWYTSVEHRIASIVPKVTWGGRSVNQNVTVIPVPTAAQGVVTEEMRPIVYINGVQVDPRYSRFTPGCPNTVELLCGTKLNAGDRFTVVTDKFDVFVVDDVIAK